MSIFPPRALAESALKFGGVSFAPGSTVQANVPLNSEEKSYASKSGNTAPANAIAVLAVPANFDPRKSWPVFIVLSTSDFHHQDRGDLARYYRSTALAEGWVLLAGDGPGQPRLDGASWRAAMTLAALDALQRSFPGSEKWPIICGGISGGALSAGFMAPLLAKNGRRVIGVYLTGVNEDHLSESYQSFQPGAGFLSTPVFIASGRDDRTARLDQQYNVMSSITRTGFQRVKIEIFNGGHEVKDFETRTALQWFRSLQNLSRN